MISSCTSEEPELHEDFMSRSDCFVYKNQVVVENFDFGRVEFIDRTEVSGCIKKQLANVFLLYQDTTFIAIYNQHPKNIISDIERFKKKYQTDSTQLSDYKKFNNSISLTIRRHCKDNKKENFHFDRYVDWRIVTYSTKEKPYIQIDNKLIATWYKWSE